ncbi:flagellar hook-length control protein FliK [Shewanella livingstonensis]|nr:flagellar hook-length control protein FliK [Shewanella livingstonensis]
MQQMSNILLGNSGKPADVGVKGNMQDVENTSFLSAFNQASEAELATTNRASNVPVLLDAEAENIEASNALELSSDENADAEMIFAQLNMADAINKRHSSGGNELPHIDQSEVYVDETFSTDPTNRSIVDNDVIELPADFVTVKEALSQLSSEELDNLMAFADLSVKDLQALDKQALSELLSDFTLQTAAVANSDESAEGKLNSTEQRQIDGSVVTSAAIQSQANTANLNTANLNTVNINAAAANSDVDRSFSSAASVSSAQGMTVDPKTILGNSTGIDGNIQSETDTTKVLAKADFSVVLDTLATKRASGDASANVNPANFGLDTVTDMSDTDTKVLQNQSSFTPIHKSDVPQFQLSLRPQGEPGAQMQEMIQRFSPVMKQQLITMVSNGIQQAEIRLDPPELGHLTVKIQIQGDQTQVQFHVAHSQTRDIVEQAMPRLRDMLAQEGLQLTDSHVSQGGGGSEQQQEQSGHQAAGDGQLDEISAQEVSLMTNPSRSLHSAIDYYA